MTPPALPSTWRKPVLLRLNHPESFAPAAQAEAADLGYPPLDPDPTGFFVRGSLLDAVRLNRWLRVCHAVLYPALSFTAHHLRQFQDLLREHPWEAWIRPDRLLCVESFARSPAIRDGRIVNQAAKDAIVDRLRERLGVRPDSGPEPEETVLFIFWHRHRVQVYLNSSGRALSHRGYRVAGGEAPLRETLAAVCVARSGWDGRVPLVDPMCGTGTLVIEAALRALARPPRGPGRTYGYAHLLGYHPSMEDLAGPPPTPAMPAPVLVAGDRDPAALAAARRNAEVAGVAEHIAFHLGDFRDLPLPSGPGVLMVNPPYGERLGDAEAMPALYRDLGTWFRARLGGWRCFVLSGNPEATLALKLKSFQHETLLNGALPCKFLGFDIRPG
jgi:putative N6-adenine-specific DNA methylase